ncbi:MAG: transcriptional regulator [Thiomicrospira sp.]|nr:MAG: transcriptional regulator [Thiomicrospira sp.]
MSNTIGKKIREIRNAEGLTQDQFSSIAGFPSKRTLGSYERDEAEPGFESMQKICAAFPQYTLYLMHEKMPVPAVEGQYTPEEKMQRDLNSQEKHA